MQRKRGKPFEARRPPHGRRPIKVQGVPTYQPDSIGVPVQAASPATTDEIEAEEAVRRMVEAAYT